jgi:RNA polymerase sigma factor (sigma-70 family)
MDAYAHVLDQLREDDCRRLRQYAEDPRAQFTTWLTLVAQRLCVDHLRQKYGRSSPDKSREIPGQGTRRRLVDLIAEEISPATPLPDTAESIDSSLRRGELIAALHSCLATLSPSERLLLAMRYEDELPAREIAKVLHYSTPFHVYRAINAALALLRLCLERRGVNDSQP